MEVSYGATTGNIDIELYDDEAPQTVKNFLRYAGRGYYTTYLNSDLNLPYKGFFHFSQPGFAIRAGGFGYTDAFGDPEYLAIPKDPPIPNESSPSRPNAPGTFAMFNPSENLNNITSQWLINLADNSALSINVVFGRVVTGMDVAEAIGNLPTTNAPVIGSTQVPLVNYTSGPIQPSNLVRVTRIPNVAAAAVPSGWAIFTADKDMTFDSLRAIDPVLSTTLLTIFKPPSGMEVHFNNDMINILMSGPMGPAASIVTMYDGSPARPTHYYAFGPTPDDPTLHWYDFAFDGVTGAEIKSDRIVLHFVDGERGDNDLTTHNKINHLGAQAVVTPVAEPQAGGCSITATPSRVPQGGEWAMIAAFMIFLAIRRRIHRSWLQ